MAQSLGEVARQERERRARLKQHTTRVLTNEDLAKPDILDPLDRVRLLAAQVAEEEIPRAEIGLFFEYQRDVDSDLNIHGYGSRLTGNFYKWRAVETTLSHDPRRSTVPVRFLHQEFAAKLTHRSGRGGVFGFVGPGYRNAHAFGFSDTRPTLKWGGGVEFYLSRHVGFRVDAGELITCFPDDRTANFFLQSGVSFRF